jgi:cytochrome c oxidase subunit 2
MLVTIGIAVGAVTTAVAYFIPWLPEQASYQADGIDFVFWLTTWICISIWALVAAVIVYAVFKFRAQPDDDSDGRPLHGHTGLEIVWTAIPAALDVIIAVASSIVLARNERTGANPLRIEVNARQFAWSFTYANGVQSGRLRLPLDETVVLRMTAHDVLHSFWVPQFRQKQDLVPGIETTLVIKPTRLGTYPVVCTELCGLGHAVMRTVAEVVRPAEYTRWLRQSAAAMEGSPEEAGATVFEENGCGSCHAFARAGTEGETGPPLDDLEASARRAGKPLEEYVRESIVSPDAYVVPRYQPGVMPKTYADLPDEQLDALVQYLIGEEEGGGEGEGDTT